jgi:hypothetical protein
LKLRKNPIEEMVPTRLTKIDFLENTYISWGKPVNDEIVRKIHECIEMVEREWLASEMVPWICTRQSAADHLLWIHQVWKPFVVLALCRDAHPDYEKHKASPPFEEYEGGYKFVLSARQMHTYKCALKELQNGKIQNFFHEFRDFIENHRENIHQPVNPAERKALAAMIYYFRQMNQTVPIGVNQI